MLIGTYASGVNFPHTLYYENFHTETLKEFPENICKPTISHICMNPFFNIFQGNLQTSVNFPLMAHMSLTGAQHLFTEFLFS